MDYIRAIERQQIREDIPAVKVGDNVKVHYRITEGDRTREQVFQARWDEGGPSSGPANGPTQDNHVHANPYPYTASPGQPKECEAGNEDYVAGKTVIGNTPAREPASTDGVK